MAAVTPGTITGTAPYPTEIDCIEVTKVYDSCFQTEDFTNLCASIPNGTCLALAEAPGTVATCEVTSYSCSFVSSVSTGVGDFVNATFAVSLTETITLTGSNAATCTITVPVTFLKTATLCAPSGTSQTCTIAGLSCGPCAIIGSTVCCQLVVCLVLQSVATVQLLVPSYGFCTPAACNVAGLPPCPPTPTSSGCSTSTTSGMTSTSTTSSPVWTGGSD